MRSAETFFCEHDFDRVLAHQENKMNEEIEGIDRNSILNTSGSDWCAHLADKYRVDVPILKEQEMYAEDSETRIDVSRNSNYFVTDRGRPFHVKGTCVTLVIPFEGDAEVFKCRPNPYSMSPPRGEIRGSILVLSCERTDHDGKAFKAELDRELAQVREHLERLRAQAKPFNDSLGQKAEAKINARREKLLKDQGLTASLGYPMKRREDAPLTYVTPAVKRKPSIRRPTPTTQPFVPEPELDQKEYEHILRVLSDTAAVIERAPHAFESAKEEDLRQLFLATLNSQYEGQATGETFNFTGKTDILIRENGKNLFVAECKFWKGPKGLTKTIDQLLGYASWRDNKTAILLFNRQKNLSSVLEQIPEVVSKHPNHKRSLDYPVETGFRFVLHHRDDANRELTLTILVFEVPVERKSKE